MDPKDFVPFFPLFAAVAVTSVISGLGLWASRKLGLTPMQAKYVNTLEGFNSSLEKKVEFAESEINELKLAVAALHTRVHELEVGIRERDQTIFELRQDIASKTRRRARPPETGS